MSDDGFGPTKPVKKTKHKKKKGKKKEDDEFDAEWEKYKAPEKPKELKPDKSKEDDDDYGTIENGHKKSKKKNKKKKDLDPKRFDKSTYVEPETSHVIEYGIHHDEIRKQRAEVKAIKEKKRKAREKAKKEEEEAKKKQKALIAAAKAKKKQTIHDEVQTKNELEYGMSEAVLRQREETKKIKEKRRKEKEEKMKLLNKKPVKHSKTPKKTIHSSVETKNDLEFGMSEAVKKKREEIKAIKEKRRKSKLQTSVPASAMTKPSKLAKKKSKRDTTKHKAIEKIPEKDDNNKDRDGQETKKPKRRLSKLKSQGTGGIEPTVDLYQTELASLKEQNIELKKQLKMSDFIKKKYELLKNENTLFKEQVAVLNEENELLKAENAELRKKLEAGGIKIDNTAFDHDDVMDTYDGNDDDRGKSQIDPKLLSNGNGAKDDDEKDITNNSNSNSSSSSSSSNSSNSNSNNNSESDSDSSDDAQETNNNVRNNAAKKLEQLKKQQEEDSDSDSDSSDDDDIEIPPEDEEPDQGESEEVQQDKENEDVNGAKMNGDDGNDSDDGSGSQSASASQSSSENEWEEWEPPQIADWMLSLDGKYKKYEKQLRKQLAEEEMHGSLLGELDETDLDRFGIKSDKHKKAIMIELKKLTAD